VAQRQAGRHEHRDERAGHHERGPEVGLRSDEQDGQAADQQERGHLAGVAQRPAALGQDPRRVEDEGELGQLGGLELHRARAQPAPRAVHRHADPRQLHGDEERERDGQQRPGAAQEPVEAAARDHVHEHDADRAVDHVLDEEAAAVARALEQRPGRGGAVDHDGAEGQQAQCRRQEDVVLERLAVAALGGGGPRHLRTVFDTGELRPAREP
jgi:hypothetical protein